MDTNNVTVFVNEEKLEKKLQNKTMELDTLYLELGKAYYEGGFEDPLPQLLPLFDKITACKKQMISGKICPQCGVENNEKARFCKCCGYSLISLGNGKYCPHCKNKVTEDDVYCGECGKRI